MIQLSHLYMTIGKTIGLTLQTFVEKVMSLLSRFIIIFLPRSKCLLISAAVTICSDFGAQEKTVTVSSFSSSICHEVMGQDAMIFVYWMLSFKPDFLLSTFTFIKKFFFFGASLVAQTVKPLLTMWETWVQSLCQEDPLEKGMATHSSIHAWKIPWTKEPGGLYSMRSQRVRHDWATSLHLASLSAIRVMSSAYLSLLIFVPGVLIPACTSSSQAFRMI